MMNEIEQYCINHSNKEDDLLKEIKQFTYQNESVPHMISGSLICNTLLMFIKMINAKRILEVGMFTGYSSLYMAQGLPEDGEIHTCEIMERHIKTATNFFNKSNYKNKIFIHAGDAINTLESFKINSFDFAFIDADKKNYIDYYNRSLQLIRTGGIIVLDNMLWGGAVLNPTNLESKVLSKLGKLISEDLRVVNLLLPIRDGIMICIKK